MESCIYSCINSLPILDGEVWHPRTLVLFLDWCMIPSPICRCEACAGPCKYADYMAKEEGRIMMGRWGTKVMDQYESPYSWFSKAFPCLCKSNS